MVQNPLERKKRNNKRTRGSLASFFQLHYVYINWPLKLSQVYIMEIKYTLRRQMKNDNKISKKCIGSLGSLFRNAFSCHVLTHGILLKNRDDKMQFQS